MLSISNNFESLSIISPNRICNHYHKVFEVACEKYDYGAAKPHCVMTSCSWVCFDTWLIWMRYGVKLTQPAPYRMQQNFAETLLKLKDIQSSCHINCLIDQFCRIWLPKQTKNGLFQVDFHQIVGKNYMFQMQNWLDMQSFQASDNIYFFMVQQVSFVYEKFLIDTILALAGLN